MSPNVFADLTNPRHWFNTEPGQPGPEFLVLLAFSFVVLVVAFVVNRRRRQLFAGDGLKMRIAGRASEIAMWISGVMLFLAIMRYGNVPYLATPILLYLTVLTGVGFIGYGIYYMTQRYPLKREAYLQQLERQRYLPAPGRARVTAAARLPRKRAVAKRR